MSPRSNPSAILENTGKDRKVYEFSLEVDGRPLLREIVLGSVEDAGKHAPSDRVWGPECDLKDVAAAIGEEVTSRDVLVALKAHRGFAADLDAKRIRLSGAA